MLTPEEKKRMYEAFFENVNKEEPDPWTEEALLKVAKKILKRLNIDEDKLQ